jgi:hypothetical protein
VYVCVCVSLRVIGYNNLYTYNKYADRGQTKKGIYGLQLEHFRS